MRLDRSQIRIILSHPAGWIASGLGSGLSPYAPGTVGSLAALLLHFWLRELPWPVYLVVIAAVFLLGTWAAQVMITRLRIADPGFIVIDEFVGQWLALIFVPHDWRWVIAGFVLFRVLDIAKPWPISWADREIHGGFGVMFDDAIAGALAGLVLFLLATASA